MTKKLPPLDQKCGNNFRYRDFVECGDTYHNYYPPNTPQSFDTYDALRNLAKAVLDPVILQFGQIKLTYGVSCPQLTRVISKGISPPHDQHASHEMNTRGKYICGRLGAAVDFISKDHDSLSVAKWIVTNCRFDRLYVYGAEQPIHVSAGPEDKKHIVIMRNMKGKGRRVPGLIQRETFLQMFAKDL